MANALYTTAKKAILDGDVDFLADTIKAALVDAGTYSFSATHDFYDDLGSAVVGTPQTLTGKTTTAGVFDAADVTFPAVSGATVEALVIYKDTGAASTSQLIAYFDTATSGLPVTPNGGNIQITFAESGILAIV